MDLFHIGPKQSFWITTIIIRTAAWLWQMQDISSCGNLLQDVSRQTWTSDLFTVPWACVRVRTAGHLKLWQPAAGCEQTAICNCSLLTSSCSSNLQLELTQRHSTFSYMRKYCAFVLAKRSIFRACLTETGELQ